MWASLEHMLDHMPGKLKVLQNNFMYTYLPTNWPFSHSKCVDQGVYFCKNYKLNPIRCNDGDVNNSDKLPVNCLKRNVNV